MLELGGVVVHVQLAGDHAIVHLAALVGALAVVGFKVHVSGDSVHTGAGVRLHLTAQGAGQLGRALNGAHALTVRGIRQHDGLLLCGKIRHIGHFKVAALFHTGQLGIGVGQRHGGGVDIISKGLEAHIQLGLGQGLLALLGPHSGGHKAVAFGSKAALEARCDVHGLLGGLNEQGAAAAEGVLHQAVPAHAAQVGDGSGQRLADGGLHGVAAVAALVQALAGGVQHDLAHVLAQHEADLVLGAALRQHGGVVLGHQALDHSLFDDALAGGHAGKLAVQRGAGDRERRIRRQQILPGDAVHAVEQLIKGGRLVAGQQQHHALHGAQVQVGCRDHLRTAGEGQAAVIHSDVLRADAVQFKFCGGLAPEETGGDQFKFCRHGGSFLFLLGEKTDPPDQGTGLFCAF